MDIIKDQIMEKLNIINGSNFKNKSKKIINNNTTMQNNC